MRGQNHIKSDMIYWCAIYKCFWLLFDTFKTMLVVQLAFNIFIVWGKKFKFLRYHRATVRVSPVERAPQFEKHCPGLLESVCTLYTV